MISLFLKNSSMVLFLKVLFSINAIFLTFQVTNNFGAFGAGVYFFIISLLSFFTSITNLGLPTSLLSKLALRNNLVYKKLLALEAVFISACCCFVVVLLLLVIDLFYEHEIISEYKLVICLLVFPFGLLLVFSSLFQEKGAFFYSTLLLNGAYQVLLNLALYLGFFSSNVLYFLYYFLAVVMLLSLVASLKYFGVAFLTNFKPLKLKRLKALFRFTQPYMLVNLLGQLSNFYIVFVLSILCATSDVGVYSVALRVALLISFITFSLNKVIAPIISSCYVKKDVESLTKIMNVNYMICGATVLPLCLALSFYSDFAMSFFGEEFSEYGIILTIVITGQLFAAMFNVNSFVLQLSGQQQQMKKIASFSVFLVLLFAPILIYFYGIMGSAIAYAFNIAFISTVCFACVYFKFSYLPFIKRINYE